jgi:hypothetical protein
MRPGEASIHDLHNFPFFMNGKFKGRKGSSLSEDTVLVLSYTEGRRSWLRHYATSGKAVDSISSAFFYLPTLSSCTMATGLTQELTEMSIRNVPESKSRRWIRLTTSPPSLSWMTRKCGRLDVFTALWASFTGIALLYFRAEARERREMPQSPSIVSEIRMMGPMGHVGW